MLGAKMFDMGNFSSRHEQIVKPVRGLGTYCNAPWIPCAPGLVAAQCFTATDLKH
jgi:hypothetical protein